MKDPMIIDALDAQMEQEAQMKRELNSLLEKFALEYHVTKYQVVGLLEETKLTLMNFVQDGDAEDYDDNDYDDDYDDGDAWKYTTI